LLRFPSAINDVTTQSGLRVVLGVTGGIAAYKAAELVRRLRDGGAEVRVVMTEGAQRFITALTFQALSGHPVRTSLWDDAAEAAMGHIELARWAEQVLIAPASADFLARLVHGSANDLLTTLCLATAAPIAVAPAMNQQMWAHVATQDNIERLRGRGVAVLGPAAGSQACGEFGPGRLLEAAELVAALSDLRRQGPLRGRRILVSAGPTYEDIDPVRYLANRSSGRMGFAVAAAARAAGAEVTLVAGPVGLATPVGVQRIDVRSAAQMRDAVLAHADAADAYVAAAAVADYRPAEPAAHKIKKSAANRALDLVPTIDILAELGQRAKRPLLVGFAAETDQVLRYAREKLVRKGLDLVAANRVGVQGQGFESEDNELTLVDATTERALGRGSKLELAQALVAEIASRLAQRAGA
jgi:phosphopantothenoylcysteine decarboxylase/phosphopantothenate--cysteine ligase